MNMLNKKIKCYEKIVSLFIILAFQMNTMGWASPEVIVSGANDTLQVQSEMFGPMAKWKGYTEWLQLRMEKQIVRQTILKNPEMPGQNIQSVLSDWYYDTKKAQKNPFKGKEPILNILAGHPIVDGTNVSIEVEISSGPEKGKVFVISSNDKSEIAAHGEKEGAVEKSLYEDSETAVSESVNTEKLTGGSLSIKTLELNLMSEVSLKDLEFLDLKSEAVEIILNTIDCPVGQEKLKNLLRPMLFKKTEEEQLYEAVIIKQKIYRDFMEKQGESVEEYPVNREELLDYTGIYKLPWEYFCDFMDKNYKNFHKNPQDFIMDISEIELDSGDINFDEISEKNICGKIHGLYVRSLIDGKKTIYINREELKNSLDDFKELLGDDVTEERALKFLDGHETFHALVDDLRLKRKNLPNLSKEDEENLADLFGKIFAKGYEDTEDLLMSDLVSIQVYSGIDLIELLKTDSQKAEELLEIVGIDVEVKSAALEEMEKIKEQSCRSGDFIRTAEASNAEIKKINQAIDSLNWTVALSEIKKLLGAKKIDVDIITKWVVQLVDAGKADMAKDIIVKAIKSGVNGLNLFIIGSWADILYRVSPKHGALIRKFQKAVLTNMFKNKETVLTLYGFLNARFSLPTHSLVFDYFKEECLRILNNGECSGALHEKFISFLRNYFERMLGKRNTLTETEAGLIRTLSVDITRTIIEACKSGRLRKSGELSFREGIRFMKIFSRYYLKDLQETRRSRVFDYFTLVAWTIYGRFIRAEDREEFSRILYEVFTRDVYEKIFVDASVDRGAEITKQEMMEKFDFMRFDGKENKEKLSYKRKILSAVERARSCNMPSFILTPSEFFPDAVVETLSGEENSKVFPLTMSGFTQQKEFFGMYTVNSKGVVSWATGAIMRIIEYAEAHPKEQVYFVLENPDFSAGDVRMALHQILLERKVTFREERDKGGRKKGEKKLPDNLQIVLTMGENSTIGDESFMDRAAGCFLPKVTEEETIEYLEKKVGIPVKIARYLVEDVIGVIEENLEIKEKVALQDIIQIGYYVAGRIKDNDIDVPMEEVVKQEAILHLEAKFSRLQEKHLIQILHEKVAKAADAEVRITKDGKSIIFGGIHIDVDPASKFGKYISDKKESLGKVPDFREALAGFLPKDYFLTKAEERMFCLLARIHKYSPSKVVFLQGLPGGGKTTIARIFLDIVGCRQQEYTLNKEVGLSLFRAGFVMGSEGLDLRTAEYWKTLGQDKTGIIFNEADTRIHLLQWLWPKISGRKYRNGWEFPSTDESNPFGRIGFGKDGLHIFTGNIRKNMPPILEDAIPATYCMERSEEDILEITKKLFLSRWSKMPLEKRKTLKESTVIKKAEDLTKVYNAIARAVRLGIFDSKREITPRHIERFKDLLFHYLEHGKSLEETYKLLLYVVFWSMWDNRKDIAAAEQILISEVTDLPPPPTAGEMIDIIKKFPLDTPVLILTNGTTKFQQIREDLMSVEDTENVVEDIIPLSRFHTKRSLIGGISRGPEDKSPVNRLGVLPWTILQSHLSGKKYFCWMPGYLNLNPQVAPLLNEFFQTNWLSVEEVLDHNMVEDILSKVSDNGVYAGLSQEYEKVIDKTLPLRMGELKEEEKKDFALFLISYRPKNLFFRAIGTAEEKVELHAADVDRFFVVNLSENFNLKWVRKHVEAGLAPIRDIKKRTLSLKCVEQACNLFDEQVEEGLYGHNRLSPADIELFMKELKVREAKGTLTKEVIKILAYHILAIGLAKIEGNPEKEIHEIDFRQLFLEKIDFDLRKIKYSRELIEEEGFVYFVIYGEYKGNKIELARQKTRYEKVQKLDDYGRYFVRAEGKSVKIKLQAPLQSLLAQQASTLIFSSEKMSVSLEGDPGGGKTSGIRDISKAAGKEYHEEGMYKWINLGTLLGSLTIKRGQDIDLNTLDKDTKGRYLLPFLRMYKDGGIFVADEGRVSKGAGHLLRWMIEVSSLDSVDLGTYHPGLQGIVVKKHPDFMLAITQNYHFRTAGREALPFGIDQRCGKIRVDNILTEEDAITLINYYLEGVRIEETIKEKLAKLHILFSKKHPKRTMISPRDLIDTIQILKEVEGQRESKKIIQLIYESITVNYLEGLVDAVDKNAAIGLVREIFEDFEVSGYENVSLSDRGHSDIEAIDVEHFGRSDRLIRKVRAMERMLTAGSGDTTGELPPARQVLIHEESGASGIGFVKLFCHLTGRKLEIIESHPHINNKSLLVGDSFEFDDEFDDTGVRKAKGTFKQTHGVLRRYMVKSDEVKSVPKEERIPTIIAISNVESIPEDELVKLNELIATRKILLKDGEGELTSYVLPAWITIVAITSDIDKLTSPFANRFRKMGLSAIQNGEEYWKVYGSQYPNLRKEEASFLFESLKGAAEYCDTSSHTLNFELGYNFTLSHLEELALRVQMYKQSDSMKNDMKTDPLWYAIKAINYVLLQAMCAEDRKIFIRNVLVPALLEIMYIESEKNRLNKDQMERYIKDTLRAIRIEDRKIISRVYEHEVEFKNPDSEKPEIHVLPNGMKIHKRQDTVSIITDATAYRLSWGDLEKKKEGIKFSEGLTVCREGNALVVKVKLVSQIGVSSFTRDEINIKRSVPMEEMSEDDFMCPANSLLDSLNALLQAYTTVKTATGREIMPRIVLVAGETGSGKTTIPRMLSQAEGTPLVRVNPWKRMSAGKLTVSLSLGDTETKISRDTVVKKFGADTGDLIWNRLIEKGWMDKIDNEQALIKTVKERMESSLGEDLKEQRADIEALLVQSPVQLNVADFLLACGKIATAGNRPKRISAAYPTSNRLLLLVDEANITRDVWYLLDAIARGEKKFKVETPGGGAVEVYMDMEIKIILTYNPAERYGGTGKGSNRFEFPKPLARKSMKIYTSEPIEDYSDDEMIEIMEEIYRRGEVYFNRQKIIKDLDLEGIEDPRMETGFFSVEREMLVVSKVDEPEVTGIDMLRERINQVYVKSEASKKKKMTKEEKQKIIKKLKKKYQFNSADLMERIENFIKVYKKSDPQGQYLMFMDRVLSKSLIGIALKQIDEKQLNLILSLARDVEPELASLLGRFADLCGKDKIEKIKVKGFMFKLDKISRERKVYLEKLNSTKGRPLILFTPVIINNTVSFDISRLRRIIGKEVFYDVFEDHVPDILVVKKENDGSLGYYDGKDMVCTHLEDKEKVLEVSSHELGHLISEKVAKQGNRAIGDRLHKNVEIYSVLFPLMLVEKPKDYIKGEIMDSITCREGPDDAYGLAAAAVLNAFCIEYAMERITDEFEEGHINAAIKKIMRLEDEKILELAIKFWQNPKQYYPEVYKGRYYRRFINIKGGSGRMETFTLSDGPVFRPRIRVTGSENIDMPEDDSSDFNPEDEEKSERMPISAKALPPASRVWMERYQKLFAPEDNGDDLEVRYVSEGGEDVNVGAYISKNVDEWLIAPQYEDEEKSLAQNVMFIIDVSGSIQSNPDLQDALTDMIYNYASFLVELSRKNSDLNISLGTVTTKTQMLFDFQEWKDAKTLSGRRALIEDALDRIWNTDDVGGIATTSILEKLSEVDFPHTGAKDVKNLVVVFTDGEEHGGYAEGDSLKAMVSDFSEGKFVNKKGNKQVQSVYNQTIDMAFVGVELSDEGAMLEHNYPCFLNLGENSSAEEYLKALFQMAFMQAKGMPLKGDLGSALSSLGKKNSPTGGFNQQLRMLMNCGKEGIASSKISGTKGYICGTIGQTIKSQFRLMDLIKKIFNWISNIRKSTLKRNKKGEKNQKSSVDRKRPEEKEAAVVKEIEEEEDINKGGIEAESNKRDNKKSFRNHAKDNETAIKDSVRLSTSLISHVDREVGMLLKDSDHKVDFELDLALINKENAMDYAKMWSYLILKYGRNGNTGFAFIEPGYGAEEGVPEELQSSINGSIGYKDFEVLLSSAIKDLSFIFDLTGQEDALISRIKNKVDKDDVEKIRISICPKEKLAWMKEKGEDLADNQYPVALAESNSINGNMALRNFEAAVAIGFCKAALVIARKKDTEEGKEVFLPGIKKEVLEKLREIYKIYIKRTDFRIDEKTLGYMISEASLTRIDLAIYHALDPIERMDIERLRERLEMINVFLEAA